MERLLDRAVSYVAETASYVAIIVATGFWSDYGG